MADGENAENIPATGKAPTPRDTADWAPYQNRYNYMSCQNWLGVHNWGQIPMAPTEKGSFAKWGKSNSDGESAED